MKTWTMNVLIFPSVNHKQPFQDHLSCKTITLTWSFVSQEAWTMNIQFLSKCHLWKAFSRPYSVKLLYWLKCCVLGDLFNECVQPSPSHPWMAISNHLLCKIIIFTQQALSLGRPEQMNVQSSPVSQTNGHIQIIYWVKLSYQLKTLSPETPEQYTCTAECSSTANRHVEIIFQKKLSYQLEALTPRRPEKWMYVFSAVTTNGHFKTIFWVKLLYLLNSKFCCLGDLTNECADSLLVPPMNSLFKTIFWVELHWLEPCNQGDLNN